MEKKQMIEKSDGYDAIAKEVFLPIFPLIAREALEVYGKTTGKCLDIGCGGGMFGYFMALMSDMEICFLDSDQGAIEIAQQRGLDWGLDDRCTYVVSDVHDMSSVQDGSMDLVISRGSIPFWGDGEELVQAFKEIERVIAPGGMAMIGGSLGLPRMSKAITAKMRERKPDWEPPESRCGGCVSGYDKKHKLLTDAGIQCEVRINDRGHWIVIRR